MRPLQVRENPLAMSSSSSQKKPDGSSHNVEGDLVDAAMMGVAGAPAEDRLRRAAGEESDRADNVASERPDSGPPSRSREKRLDSREKRLDSRENKLPDSVLGVQVEAVLGGLGVILSYGPPKNVTLGTTTGVEPAADPYRRFAFRAMDAGDAGVLDLFPPPSEEQEEEE